MRALLIWSQRVTADYRPKVDVRDFTASFRDGLAFCAIIHHFRPALIGDFSSLRAEDVLANNRLAFSAAEEHLDVPALLDPEDMAGCQEPDKFSVVTYLSQLYHVLKDEDGSRQMVRLEADATTTRVARNSESSESGDSLLQSSSSSDVTPVGTPSANKKKDRRGFSREELIAKYGEEIFSVSKERKEEEEEGDSHAVVGKRKTRVDSPMVKSKFAGGGGGGGGVGAICRGLEARMRIFEKES